MTPLASIPTLTGFQGGASNLVISPSGDLITTVTSYSSTTSSYTGVVYDLVHTATGYAAAPLALAGFNGSAGPDIVTDAAGDVFGTIVPSDGTTPATVFELPRIAGGYGPLVTLATLNPGETPTLAIDSAGNLFGSSGYNYTNSKLTGVDDFGRVFELAKNASGYLSTIGNIYKFSASQYPDNTVGSTGLAVDSADDLFFTSGSSFQGMYAVLEITHSAAGFSTTPTTLLTKTASGTPAGSFAALSLDAAGDLIIQNISSLGTDAIEVLQKSGGGATGYQTSPSVIDIEHTTYGAVSPADAALVDANGDVFRIVVGGGSTRNGGLSPSNGVLSEVVMANGSYPSLSPSAAASAASVIYAFDPASTVGALPVGSLVVDAKGVLYGLTQAQGSTTAFTFYQVTNSGYVVAAAPANTPPVIGGTVAGQATTDKATAAPFSTATLTDPDAGQTETVTVSYTAANGTLAGGGFTGSAGSYSASFASAAAAQAGLRALVFTPSPNEVTPGATVTTGFTVAVSDGQATATDTGASVVATSVNDAPTLGGVPETVIGQAGAATLVAPSATVGDPDVGQTYTLTIQLGDGRNGTVSGGGFHLVSTNAQNNATYTVAAASVAAAQADLRAATFTPVGGVTASTAISFSVSDGIATATQGAETFIAVAVAAANTPPAISGTVANQPDAAGVAVSPFTAVTVTDPDAGQTETVTVSFTAANGTLTGAGFTGAGGTLTGSFASAAAAQAALRALSFTPAAGQSATTGFTVSVSDGQATATDSTTSVVANYTPPVTGGGATPVVPASVRYGLQTEFQNLERALASGADALNPSTPVYAAFQAERGIAAQLDSGSLGLAQVDSALAHLVDGTTGVAVASYAFFTGYTPTAAGLNYLVHSAANATDLNDAYYARFSTENRYINFAANLATGAGAGAAAFQAAYGSLSLADATAKAYLAVFGATADAAKVSALLNTLVPDGLGGQETRAQYFAQYGGDGPNGQGTKAAMVGFLLANAVHDGSGVYGTATENYLAAVAHGQAPASGSELALHYGAAVSLVGVTPIADPMVTG